MDAAIKQLERVRETWRAMKITWYESYTLLDLVVAHSRIGQYERSRELLAMAEASIGATHEFYWLDILYRIKGELLFAQVMSTVGSATGIDGALQLDKAEAAFRQSLQLTRTHQSKTRELQATTGLCRLWQFQGKVAEARSSLAEIYDWFTEGFDTADLMDAKALLETLTIASSYANSEATG
jgi:adenylate cyclase